MRFLRWKKLGFAVAALGAAVMTGGCVITGASGCEMKRALNESFTFTATDRLYPDGVGEWRRGDSTAQAWIEDRLRLYAKALREAHGNGHARVAKMLDHAVESKPKFRVDVTDRRKPIASVDETGRITIDVQVVEALFRGSLVEGLQQAKFGPGNDFGFNLGESPTDEQMVSEFVRLKKEVRNTDCNSRIGEIFSGGGDWSWHKLTDFLEVGDQVERKFAGALLFILAHEFGHIALRHFDTEPQSEREFQDRELKADAYAAVLLADMFRNIIAVDAVAGDTFFGARDWIGYHDFFANSFERIGFDTNAEGFSYAYPSREAREAVAQLAFESVQQQITAELEERWKAALSAPEKGKP